MGNRFVGDNFLSNFDSFREHMLAADYGGVVNPVDKVTYPDCSYDIPETVKAEIVSRLSHMTGRVIDPIHGFVVRLTAAHTATAPHQAHTDAVMSQFTFLLYLSDGVGGTALVSHKETGMNANPVNDEELAVWERDHNIYDAWNIDELIPMKANRAVIIPSELMHRAEPVEGYGSTVYDGRLVLISFINLGDVL